MSNIRSTYNNDVRYSLYSSVMNYSHIMNDNPGNWNDDNIHLDRHADYHGIFYTFSEDLEFYKDDKEYILTAFDIGGINTNLYLRKDILRNVDGVTRWYSRYISLADFNTVNIKDNSLNISFNSLDLAELIKTYESDEFEIEREDDVDGNKLDSLETHLVRIKGRSLQSVGESIFKTDDYGPNEFVYTHNLTPLTRLVSQLQTRHSEVLIDEFDKPNDYYKISAENLIFDNSTDVNAADIDLNLTYSLNFSVENAARFLTIDINVVEYNSGDGTYSIIESERILEVVDTLVTGSYNINNVYENTLTKDQGLMFEFRIGGSFDSFVFDSDKKSNVIIREVEEFIESPNLKFSFIHDVAERLMYIITGRKDAFYSKFYGRTELEDYTEDGEGGLIGLISGLWIRNFDESSDKYKSLLHSLKNLITTCKAVNNVGVGIETINYKQRLRIEELRYFYQNEVVVELPFKLSNVNREIDESSFYSSLEFGYEHGGNGEDKMGLDEPNTRTNWISPIKKSSNKYVSLSKDRSDEYEMERLRRRPQKFYPDEDTTGDTTNWLLDLKRSGNNYEQKDWNDRLNELPYGIYSPETYRSMYFTPLQMLRRHAWVFKNGMGIYKDRFIKYINSVSNSKLTTFFIGDEKALPENGDIKVEDLDRCPFSNWRIRADHPIDDDLMDIILGSTEVEDDNGNKELIPNYYFKFRALNEKNEYETFYLESLKPGKTGSFVFIGTNEKFN